MKKAVFLDRDGVLNLDKGYTFEIEDYQLLPGVKTGLKKLTEAGFSLIILTSQSGIGRGFYNEKDYQRFMEHMLADFASSDIKIEAVEFCPHHSESGKGKYKIDCDCRKPKPGLVLTVDKSHGPFDFEKSWSIGNSIRDLEMTKRADKKINCILVPKNFDTESAGEMVADTKDENVDYTARDFLEAVDIILKK